MNRYLRVFASEFKRNLIEFSYTNMWIMGLFIFIIGAIYSSLPDKNSNFMFLNFPFPISYFYYSFLNNLTSSGTILIIYILSSLIISQDIESGKWDLLKAFKVPKFPIYAAKWIWLVLYSTICLLLSMTVFSIFIFTRYFAFQTAYLFSMMYVILIYVFIFSLACLTGMFISLIGKKRIPSILLSIGYFLGTLFIGNFISSVYLRSPGALTQNLPSITKSGVMVVSPNFSFTYKFLYLLNVTNFNNYSAYLLNIYSLNMPTDNGPPIPGIPSFSVPLFFNPPETGFIEIFAIQFIIFSIGIYLVEVFRSRRKNK